MNFILLIGLLEGYFVPLYLYYMTPQNFDQKVFNNISLSFHFALDVREDDKRSLLKPLVFINLITISTGIHLRTQFSCSNQLSDLLTLTTLPYLVVEAFY